MFANHWMQGGGATQVKTHNYYGRGGSHVAGEYSLGRTGSQYDASAHDAQPKACYGDNQVANKQQRELNNNNRCQYMILPFNL
jgi:hypothetical protein